MHYVVRYWRVKKTLYNVVYFPI